MFYGSEFRSLGVDDRSTDAPQPTEMSLPNILEGEGQSLTAGALLYTFGLVSLETAAQQPRRAAVHDVEQSRPVRRSLRRISSEEVALHHHADSAWLIIKQKVAPWRRCSARVWGGGGFSPSPRSGNCKGAFTAALCVTLQVYDVTDFWGSHPGGRVILLFAGRDATDVFSTFHSSATWAHLKPLCIGTVAASILPPVRTNFAHAKPDHRPGSNEPTASACFRGPLWLAGG